MRVVLLLSLLAACADSAEPSIDEVEAADVEDGKADADAELKVRTGDTSVWMTRDLARRETDGGPLFVLRGRASRTITEGTGFIIDDPYGDFVAPSARTFEVTWPVSTARTLVDGVNQFVRLGFVHSSSRPDLLTTRVVVRPRLGGFTGSSSVYVTAELVPVVLGGVVVYRAHGHTSSPMSTLRVTANGISLTDIRRLDDTHFELDLAPDVAFAIAGTSEPIAIDITLATGQAVTKRAHLGLAIKKLGITAADPYDLWPRPTCTTATESCLRALPDGAVDLAACGEALPVLACTGRVGVFADDVSIQAALADGAARTADPAFLADADGLVGTTRRDAFAFGAQQVVDDRVTHLFGRWYLSAATRTTALTRAVDGAILTAYAHPLDLVDPTTPNPTDPTAVRAVAADALLTALAAFDFPASEYARPYASLVSDFRAQHVASIRAFRETLPIEPFPGQPGRDVIVGSWLDPYVEVSIDRATGTAAGVLIEID